MSSTSFVSSKLHSACNVILCEEGRWSQSLPNKLTQLFAGLPGVLLEKVVEVEPPAGLKQLRNPLESYSFQGDVSAGNAGIHRGVIVFSLVTHLTQQNLCW